MIDLEKQVRVFGSIGERIKRCHEKLGKMCRDGRPPHMTIPVHWDDDDFFISLTLDDAMSTIDGQSALLRASEAEIDGLRGIIKIILRSLPHNRDWLDPDLEKEMREVVK